MVSGVVPAILYQNPVHHSDLITDVMQSTWFVGEGG